MRAERWTDRIIPGEALYILKIRFVKVDLTNNEAFVFKENISHVELNNLLASSFIGQLLGPFFIVIIIIKIIFYIMLIQDVKDNERELKLLYLGLLVKSIKILREGFVFTRCLYPQKCKIYFL